MRRWLLVFVAGGCAPAYRPPTPFVPMLLEKGDLSTGVRYGTGGVQADVAVAPVPHLGVRAGGQYAGFASQGLYGLGHAGIGVFGELGDGYGWGLTLDGGGGYSRAITTVDVQSQTTGGLSQVDRTEIRTSGTLATLALRNEWGLRMEHGMVGGQVGPTFHQIWHDGASSEDGVGQMVMLEGAGVARGGPGPVWFEGSLGLAWPVWVNRTNAVGVPVPVVFGIGVSYDRAR
jgi:hypothetical protein